MELLNLPLPRKMYLLDFLAEKEMKEKIQNSWILIHDSIIAQLECNYGFKRKEGARGLHILYRNKNKVLEEIAIDNEPLPFRNWSALVAIGSGKIDEYEHSYEADTITTEPEYLILLKMEA